MSTRYTWSFNNGTTPANIDVYGNWDPDVKNTSIKELVIPMHGSGRNAPGIADAALKAAQLNGEKAGEYGVVAIDFSTSGEQRSGEPYWTSNGWKQGDLSPDAAFGPRISSFTVMDKLVQEAATNLPNLESVVFTGHSAGGQFMARYGPGGNFTPLDAAGVDYSVVAANPSSWMYFDKGINYKYGTSNLNDYMTKTGGHDGLVDQMKKIDFAIFAGTEDDFNEGDLDTSASAMAQGANRWERAVNYETHLDKAFGDLPNHYFVDAPGVGHSGSGMFTSNAGQELLWGDWDVA